MAKKILVFVCILALLTGVSAATVLQADASSTNYQVGCSRVDINPYIYQFFRGRDWRASGLRR